MLAVEDVLAEVSPSSNWDGVVRSVLNVIGQTDGR